MKKLPWASWKFWGEVPSSPRQQVHLGIDYGTSTSKIVFRIYGDPGRESAILVVRNGSFRFPSRVCFTATELLFGDDNKHTAGCNIYESLKMRVAAEVSGNPEYYLSPTKLPDGFSAADLAALTVWFLISEGHRAAAAQFNGMEGVEIGMTMGVPMPFFSDNQLKASFLSIARRAWSFYCQEGLVDSAVLIKKARRVLEKHPVEALSAIPEHEVQDWIRCEGEAAIWWLLRSPSIRAGPYAKVDIGAGTTHANLFRIFGKVQTPRRSLAPFGAAAVCVGTDAVDRAVAECEGLSSDCSASRGREQSVMRPNAKVREALMPVCEQIYASYRQAWTDACREMHALELSSWEQHKVFVMGGGSLLPLLVDTLRMHPDQQKPLCLMPLEQPIDLVRADRRKMTGEELPFGTVAYGLSNIGSSLPNPWCRDRFKPP